MSRALEKPNAPLPSELDEFIAQLAEVLAADYERREQPAQPTTPGSIEDAQT